MPTEAENRSADFAARLVEAEYRLDNIEDLTREREAIRRGTPEWDKATLAIMQEVRSWRRLDAELKAIIGDGKCDERR